MSATTLCEVYDPRYGKTRIVTEDQVPGILRIQEGGKALLLKLTGGSFLLFTTAALCIHLFSS